MKNHIIEDFLDEIKELQKAKKLLDEILMHYDVYNAQFNHLDTTVHGEKEIGFSPFGIGFPKSEASELNAEIRSYMNFDDSE
jgi:hypothetical protein